MDTNIIGISGLYHDSAACLVQNGQIITALQEERFSRKKHDSSFPIHSIRHCLRSGNISPEELTSVVFYEKPLLRFDRVLETYLMSAPVGVRSFIRAMGAFLNEKLRVPDIIDQSLENKYRGPIQFVQHHQAHAASAFYPSPFQEAAILTIDGVGEWATTSIGVGNGNTIRLIKEIRFPHSLGLLYSAFTYYCGFKVNSGEYKLMGLAPYGKPKYSQIILDELIDLKADGSYRLNMKFFSYCHGLKMINRHFCKLFNGPPRTPDSPICEHYMDVAASIQYVLEESILRLTREAFRVTGQKRLCLAGGVALNCVANGKIAREGPFDSVWVQPAAGDDGAALGAALFAGIESHGCQRPARVGYDDRQRGSYLGSSYSSDQIQKYLATTKACYHKIEDFSDLCEQTAELLADGKVVGWFQGPMEFGPRALGGRSILADPRDEQMQSHVNTNIKFREDFRPFAPVVLKNRTQDYFDLDIESPYMLFTAFVAPSQRIEAPQGCVPPDADLSKRLHQGRSTIPAVTHVDYSARVQTCDNKRNGRFYQLMKAWEKKTECGVLLNTSFNVRGEPMVRTPADAYTCFMKTNMDILVMEDFILFKKEQLSMQRRKHFRSSAPNKAKEESA